MIYQLQRWYRSVPEHVLLAICLFLLIETAVVLLPLEEQVLPATSVSKERIGSFDQFKVEFQRWKSKESSTPQVFQN